jgi:phosphoenolpyruvate carboxylase
VDRRVDADEYEYDPRLLILTMKCIAAGMQNTG